MSGSLESRGPGSGSLESRGLGVWGSVQSSRVKVQIEIGDQVGNRFKDVAQSHKNLQSCQMKKTTF